MGEDKRLILASLMPHLGFTLWGIVASCLLLSDIYSIPCWGPFLLNILKFVFVHNLYSKTLAGTEKLEIFVKQSTGNGLIFWCASFEFCLIYKQITLRNL